MVDPATSDPSRHDDLLQTPSSQPSAPNPFAQSSDVTIIVPESIEVRLVDANVLGDYEMLSALTALIGSMLVGFAVPYFLAEPAKRSSELLTISIALLVLVLITGWITFKKRQRLHSKTRRLRYKVGEQIVTKAAEEPN